jgi:hypothetical protein
MRLDELYAWSVFALFLPFWVVGIILVHYWVKRTLWRCGRRRGFCPSSVALGRALQFAQVYHRPSVTYVLEAKQDEDAEDEGNGDPDSPGSVRRQLQRQLKRIRKGEAVDRLVLRV